MLPLIERKTTRHPDTLANTNDEDLPSATK